MYDPYGFPIRVPGKLLEELGAHTGKFWSSLDLEPIVCDLIREFIKPAAAPALPAPAASQPQADTPAPAVAPFDAGYQWKEVFLPAGTKLRASFARKPYFAVVEGAEIKYGEHSVSPSCFANLQGSGNRNAWKAIWLLLPGSDGWLPADVFRSARKAVIARLLAGDASPVGQQAGPASAPPPPSPDGGNTQPPRATRVGGAGGIGAVGALDVGKRGRLPGLPAPAAAQSGSRATPPRLPVAADNGAGPKKNTGRAARRKRRLAKRRVAAPAAQA